MLFADAILFQTRVFPTALMYFCLAGVAFMLARLAVQPVSWPAQIAAFIVLLAITWSLAQYRDLSWQYEVQFPLLHVFALAGLYAFAIALSTDDSNRYLWFAVAFLCDFLTAWSGGSGILLTVSLVLLVIWLLRADRAVAIFFSRTSQCSPSTSWTTVSTSGFGTCMGFLAGSVISTA